MTPYPGTELYEAAVRNGYFSGARDFRSMHVSIPHMEMPEVKSGKLKWLQFQAYMTFYIQPRRLAKLASSVYLLKTFARNLWSYVSTYLSYCGKKLSNQFR